MNLYSTLRSIRWLRKVHQWYCRYLREDLGYQWFVIPILWYRYSRRLNGIRKNAENQKLRVAFLVSNASKWKLQSLYDAMMLSRRFKPFMVLSPMDIDWINRTHTERCAALELLKNYFSARGMKVEIGYDYDTGDFIDLIKLKPDIVWYTQPWMIHPRHSPATASRYALTCYIPYFVQNYGGLDMDCGTRFHRYLWRHFTLNESWARIFLRYQGCRRAGSVIGVGHPMLDLINVYSGEYEPTTQKRVIYAPHWSCNTGECFSTFLTTGKFMLEYAQNHPEIYWVFKPHPTLRDTLIQVCGWEKHIVDDYYSAWEKFGEVCYNGSYVEQFEKSMCLITDCASFLIEYACTGKPIIHLISDNAVYQPHPIVQRLFESYYQVHTIEELQDAIVEIILQGKDPRKYQRLEAVKQMNLTQCNAAENILGYLNGVIDRGRT